MEVVPTISIGLEVCAFFSLLGILFLQRLGPVERIFFLEPVVPSALAAESPVKAVAEAMLANKPTDGRDFARNS